MHALLKVLDFSLSYELGTIILPSLIIMKRAQTMSMVTKLDSEKATIWMEVVYILSIYENTHTHPILLFHVPTWQQILATLKWFQIVIQFFMTHLLRFQLLGQQA